MNRSGESTDKGQGAPGERGWESRGSPVQSTTAQKLLTAGIEADDSHCTKICE